MELKRSNVIQRSFVVAAFALALAASVLGQEQPGEATSGAAPRSPLRISADQTLTGDALALSTTDTTIIYPFSLTAPWPLVKLDATANVGPSLRFMKAGTATAFLGVSDAGAPGIDDAESGDLSLRVENKNIRFSANAGASTQLLVKASGNVGATGRVVVGQLQYPESTQLHVAGSAMFGGEGGSYGTPRVTIGASQGGYGTIGFNFLPSATSNEGYTYLGADKASQMVFYNGGFRLRTAPAGTAGGTIAFTDAVTILNTGEVGIGTTTPAAKLHVNGNIIASGSITGASVIGAVYQDLAEWVPASTDMAPGTVVVLNRDTKNEVMPSASAYDTTVAGVVSAAPGIILGFEGHSKEKVATTGRVKVRVDARSNSVRVGDLLVTSDTPGAAMRSEPVNINGRMFHQPGTIIGKALEPLEGGIGEILVLLSMQ